MKKAIIIGATSGIGKELALLLAKKGYRIGITGRRQALLESVKSENPEYWLPISVRDLLILQWQKEKVSFGLHLQKKQPNDGIGLLYC